jgi:hypothetical protein
MTVAYLHGFASGPGSTKARFFAARLADAGTTVHVPDLAPDFTNMTVTSMLAIVDALLDATPTILMGSSLGGYLAALAAARRPDRVPKLVLFAPAFDFGARWEASVGTEAMARWRARGTAPVFHYALGREVPLGIGLLDDTRHWPAAPDPVCPTLVFHGHRDDAVPITAARAFVARRPTERTLVEYDAGHELTEVLEPMWSRVHAWLGV